MFANAGRVPIRHVEKSNTEIEGSFENRPRVRRIQRPGFPFTGAEGHRAEAQFAYLQAGPPK